MAPPITTLRRIASLRSPSPTLARKLTAGLALSATIALGTASAASAQATSTTVASPVSKLFCAQMRNSQSVMAKSTAKGAELYKNTAAEWAKIARFAPPAIKADVTAIQAAYGVVAADPTKAGTALKGLGAAATNVTNFVNQSCPANTGDDGDGGPGGPGGPGGRGAFDPNNPQFKAFADCVPKNGGSLTGGFGGRGGGGGGPADEKQLAANQGCRDKLPAGGFGGGGGRGGFQSPELQACLKSKGVTLPSTPANAGGPNGGGNAPIPSQGGQSGQSGGQGRGPGGQFGDPKFRAALDACRTKLGLPARGGPGGPGRRPANGTPSTTLAKV